MLKDLVAMLETWPVWKRVKATPDRVDALETRIARLEAAITAKPADQRPACPSCGDGRMVFKGAKKDPTFGVLGGRQVTRACDACGFEDTQLENPS
jgi:hypothetical protein